MIQDFAPVLPAGFQFWPPWAQAAALFLGTFVLEDAVAIGAGLLLGAGALGWPTAFGACFLGIWLGDAGLYALARYGGRDWFERSRFRRHAARVERSEQWFAKRGNTILIFSRAVPGTRLPTYLAAGFLRLPLARFMVVTGAAALVWTLGILLVFQAFGQSVFGWWTSWRQHGWLALGGLAGGGALLWSISRPLGAVFDKAKVIGWLRLRGEFQLKASAKVGRWTRWEFWPGWLFYPPVALHCAWLAVKYRGLTLPTAANPGIFAGGVVGESKHAILHALQTTSPEFTAGAELLQGRSPAKRLTALRQICVSVGLEYPFILKPDLGQRGAGVKLIRAEAQAVAYLAQTNTPLVVQRYAPGPCEAGIFYYRLPGQATGRIFGVTNKIFPSVMGDGRSTIEELVWRDSRARFLGEKYLARFSARRDEILPPGESLRLVEAGNHAQGCIFRDGADLITPELTRRIDEISRKLNGFFIGRYDIRYANADDLRAGRNFRIVELNGAAAEATNIYDARNSLGRAYATLFRQWDLVFAIGAANRARGAKPMTVREVWAAWREFARRAGSYPAAD